MSHTYTYSISLDFPGGKVNTTKLTDEIRASAIVTALDMINTDGDEIDIVFKAELSAGDKTILDGNQTHPAGGLIAAHDNTPSTSVQSVQMADSHGNPVPTQFDDSGMPLSSNVKPYGLKYNPISPNWCDKTTWYEQSVKCEETLVEDVDGKTFLSPTGKVNWIDTLHGKLFNEDALVESLGPDVDDPPPGSSSSSSGEPENFQKLRVRAFVDGERKYENSPGQTDKDFTVDYTNGKVVFNTTAYSGKQVDAVFWYENGSQWTIAPPAGSKIQLVRVELQFSKNIVIRDTMVYSAYGYVKSFAPYLMSPPYNYPGEMKIPIDTPIRYKSVSNYVSESNGTYPIIPAFGGDYEGGWRKQGDDILTLPWDYVARTDLHSSMGMELRVTTEKDMAHEGELATVAFYCLRLPEDD